MSEKLTAYVTAVLVVACLITLMLVTFDSGPKIMDTTVVAKQIAADSEARWKSRQ